MSPIGHELIRRTVGESVSVVYGVSYRDQSPGGSLFCLSLVKVGFLPGWVRFLPGTWVVVVQGFHIKLVFF